MSWLASFPSSPVEPGGYPYNLLLDKNRVSKKQHESEYWERVMWGWRTGMLGFDIVYAMVSRLSSNLPNQRLKRANDLTMSVVSLFSLVDVGLTGRFLATVDKEDKRGIQIANEVVGLVPSVFSFLRNIPGDLITKLAGVAALFVLNVGSLAATTTFNIILLKDSVDSLKK